MPTDEAVEGLQALLDSMESLPLVLQKTLIVRALRKAAEPIKERAVSLAPDDPATAGSSIAESIRVSVVDQTATGAIAQIGPTKHGYAGIFAEEGTSHQHAEPFLAPAFEELEPEAFDLLGQVLGDGIEEEFMKRSA